MEGDDLLSTLILLVLLGLGLALWWLHRLIAWAVLLLVRDAVVYLWGEDLLTGGEATLVVVWRLVVPVGLFIFGGGLLVSQLLVLDLPWLLALPLGATTGGLLVYHYHRLYDQRPPHQATWPRFLAAEIQLRSAVKLAWIAETFRWKL